jgi:hypothetical protein
VFLSALFYNVSSYTFGSVKSLATVMITDNSNALISIPSFDQNKRRYSVSDDGHYHITVINNLDKRIDARSDFDYDTNQINITFPTGKSIRLNSGQSGHIPFTVSKADDEPVSEPTVIKEKVHVAVFADWDGGNAQIDGSIVVALRMEPTEILVPQEELEIPQTNDVEEHILPQDEPNKPHEIIDESRIDKIEEKPQKDQDMDEDHIDSGIPAHPYEAEDSSDISDSHDPENILETENTESAHDSNEQPETSEELMTETNDNGDTQIEINEEMLPRT